MQLPDVTSCCSEFTSQEGQQHFLQLPADALFVIVSGLDSAGLASLQSTCHQLRHVVHVNELWKRKLQHLYPFWLESGIRPCPSQPGGESWQMLMSTATEVTKQAIEHRLQSSVLDLQLWSQLGSSAEDHGSLQLDFWLCSSDHELRQPYKAVMHLRCLLDAVYFFWLHAKHLQRGARMLAKGIALLADHVADYASIAPKGQQDHIWFTTTDLAKTAAAAGAFLMDLLQMKQAANRAEYKERRHSTAESNGETAPSTDSGQPEALEFVWYGQTYQCQDLHEAVAILGDPAVDTASAVDANQPGVSPKWLSEDVWQRRNWKSMSCDAQLLLQRLSACHSYTPQDEGEGKPGEALLWKAARIASSHAELSPHDVCRAHQLFAGAALLQRFFCGRYVSILQQHKRMYKKAGLQNRAGWYKELSSQKEVLPTYAPGHGDEQVSGQIVDGSVQGALHFVDANVQNPSGNVDLEVATGSESGTGQTVSASVQSAPAIETGAAQTVDVQDAPDKDQGAVHPVSASLQDALGSQQGAGQTVSASVQGASGNETGAAQSVNVQDAPDDGRDVEQSVNASVQSASGHEQGDAPTANDNVWNAAGSAQSAGQPVRATV